MRSLVHGVNVCERELAIRSRTSMVALARKPALLMFDADAFAFALGDGDALELIAALGPRRPRIAILVTGYGSPEEQARSRAAGFDAHLVKPVMLDQLDAALRRELARKSPPEPPDLG